MLHPLPTRGIVLAASVAFVAILFGTLASETRAQNVITMRTISGQPQVLWSPVGSQRFGYNPGMFSVTNDGLVVHYNDAPMGYLGTYTHDPALASPNNNPVDSRVGLVPHYSSASGALRGIYGGSVPGGDTSNNAYYGGIAEKGITRQTPSNTYFGWTGGGTVTFFEVQLQDSAGNYNPTAGTAAMVGRYGFAVDGGYHKDDLELYGPGTGADTWRLLGGTRGPPANTQADKLYFVRKIELGALTGQTATVAGTRPMASGGLLVDGSGSEIDVINELVPLLSDTVKGYGINPADGHLYFVSEDLTNAADPRVYLSALDLGDWGALGDNLVGTPFDLDPDSAQTYLDLTYDSGDSNPDLMSVRDLAFSPDGSELYVLNGQTGTDARFFIFDIASLTAQPAVVPEPSTWALMAIGLAGMAVLGIRRRCA